MLEYIAKEWISIAALLLAGLAAFQDRLRRFSLQLLSAGRISITRNPFRALKHDCLMIDVILENLGARRGVVEDIAVRLHADKDVVTLRSFAEVTDTSIQVQKDLAPLPMRPSSAIAIGRNEALVKRIMFVPTDPDSEFQFRPCAYEAEVVCRTSRHAKWKTYARIAFDVDADDVHALDGIKGVPQGRGIVFYPLVTRDKAIASSEH